MPERLSKPRSTSRKRPPGSWKRASCIHGGALRLHGGTFLTVRGGGADGDAALSLKGVNVHGARGPCAGLSGADRALRATAHGDETALTDRRAAARALERDRARR